MTHVISLLNMKGGVGKTTSTVILGEFLAGELGRKVLLVDMDPQISLSITMLGEKQWLLLNGNRFTLAQLFIDALHEDDEQRNQRRGDGHRGHQVDAGDEAEGDAEERTMGQGVAEIGHAAPDDEAAQGAGDGGERQAGEPAAQEEFGQHQRRPQSVGWATSPESACSWS